MLDPEESFKLEPHNIEYRKELLTGRTCRITLKDLNASDRFRRGETTLI